VNKNLIQKFLDRACYDEQDQRELEDWCNVEKFAELIVRECAGLINSMDHSSQYFPHVADAIKEHFGVKE
jgi:hypothetical protein